MTTSPPAVDPDVLVKLDLRGVTEARHFTTSRGLLGILQSRRVYSREHLAEDDQLALIAINNCYRRWDTPWFGHVNLSLQRINGYLYGISSTKWHLGEDLWWAVLGFDRRVLAHPGVVFVTTNNGYSVAQRATGVDGLQALYADTVTTWRGNGPVKLDRAALAPDQTTSPQAEALYPGFVDTAWLRTIYVPRPELADTVHGWFAATTHPPVTVVADPEAFA